MAEPQRNWLTLGSDELSAAVDPHGAQLSTLQDSAGRDILWNGDPAVWSGRAPLLFPIVGMLNAGRYRLGSSIYRLPRHGFARGKRFALLDSSPSSALFRLNADDETLQIYPFCFELDVRFSLEGPTLSLATSVRNKGDETLWASFGYHPAFRWPLPFGRPRSSHFIEFADEEPSPVRRLDCDGLLMPTRHPTPVAKRRLTLRDSLFEEDVIVFDQIRSRCVIYGSDDGPQIRVRYPDAPYLGVWTKPHANFICIEPWHGVADPEGFVGDFKEKPGVFSVAPGAQMTICMAVTLMQVT